MRRRDGGPHGPHRGGRDAAAIRLPAQSAGMDALAGPGRAAARRAGRASVRPPRRRSELAGRCAAELDVVSARFAADQPTTHARLRTRVRAFAGRTPGDPLRPEDLAVHAIVLLLLGALSAYVATLIFARTAMRESELVIRHALGASRARVIAQIVTEGLVLALAAAVCGLIVAQTTVRYVWARATQIIGDGLPFWVDLKLEPVTPCVRRTCAPSATCSTDRGAAAGVTCSRGRSRSRVVLGSRSRPARPANTTTG